MRFKRVIMICLAAAVTLLPLTGCNASKKYEAMELVPDGVDILAGIKVSEAVRNWQLYVELEANEKASTQYDEMRESFHNESGLDLNDISKVVMFGRESAMENMEYTGIILEGNFAGGDLIGDIEKNTDTKFESGKYGDFTLYTNTEGDAAIVRINNTMIVMGSIQAVKDSIDVAGGTPGLTGGVVLDTYNDLGDVMVKLAMSIPQEAKSTFTDEPENSMMPVGMEAFEDMQSLGLSADLGTQALTVSVSIDFIPADSAAKAAESLKELLDFIGMMSQDEESAELIDRIEIKTGSSRVYLNYEISLAELMDMIESFESGEIMPVIPMGPPDMELPDDFEIPEWSEDDFELPEDFESPEIPEE